MRRVVPEKQERYIRLRISAGRSSKGEGCEGCLRGGSGTLTDVDREVAASALYEIVSLMFLSKVEE